MNSILSYYSKYREFIPEYKNWIKGNNQNKAIASTSVVNKNSDEKIKQKAKAIAEPLLLQDSYEHEKAEDAETFYQTVNIELMSLTGVISSFPAAITKLLPFFEKHSNGENFSRKMADFIKSYKDKTIKLFSKNIPLPKALTVFSTILGMSFFAFGIKKSMESQLGLIRKASFDSTQSIINDPKLFAIHTPEQEKEVNSIVNYENSNNSSIVDKLQDKINLTSTFKSVKEYKTTKQNYEKQKDDYLRSLDENQNKKAYKHQIEAAEEDQKLFDSLMKNVEHKVLERLRRVETISNIAYSSLFTGGFLEYLLTDKLVQVMGVKNKALAATVKFGAPLITYLLLNKNISDIENKAILATKYKHLKQFTENPLQYADNNETEKQSLPKFISSVYKDMKEYDKFSKEELPLIKQRLEAKRQILLSKEQENEARRLQKNTSMVINKHREEVYNQTVGVKAFSESILGPIDIVSTAVGALIGKGLGKKYANPKYNRLFVALGAVAAFIPAAIIEAKLTKQQKLAEKIAAMNTIKSIQNPKQFVSYTQENNSDIKIPKNSETFKDFIN